MGIHFIEEALFNAYTVYRKCGESGHFLDFKLNVIDALQAPAEKAVFAPGGIHPTIGQHFLQIIPTPEGKKQQQGRCIICLKDRGKCKEGIYRCKTCDEKPHLCPAPCFEIFHTL